MLYQTAKQNALTPVYRHEYTSFRSAGKRKKDALSSVLLLVGSTDAVELQGESALLVSGVILVKNTLRSSLIDSLDCDLVSTLGLGAIAFSGSRLELLERGLQCGLIGLVAGVADLSDLNALLGRLNIRQTKHLLRIGLVTAKIHRAD